MLPSNYRRLGQIGQGQFGKVYCAIHRQTGEIVALKDLDQLTFPTNKLLRELSFLVSLQHPNIVRWKGLEHHHWGRYLVMDYCNGGTLRNLLESSAKLNIEQILKLVIDVLEGLNHVHQKGIVHCDIKPENILLNITANGWTAKLSDFGIARLLQEAELVRQSGGYTGSPAYMAPERFYGKYYYTSDIYAVGVLLFELIVGKRPFSGFPGELMSAHLNQSIKIPEIIPTSLTSIIEIALRKLSQRRFSSAGEMSKALQLVTESLSTSPSKSYFFKCPDSFPIYPFKIVNQTLFSNPITQIVIESQFVYLGMENKLCCQAYSDLTFIGTNRQWTVELPGDIIEIIVRPTGCFIWTRSLTSTLPNYTLYQIFSTSQPTIILSVQTHHLINTISPNGEWLAMAVSDTVSKAFRIFKLPILQPIVTLLNHPFFTQLFALNNHYGIAIGELGDWQLFNRRGKVYNLFSLPFSWQLLTLIQASPYRLLGIDSQHPSTAILINLKPLKITRIPLTIKPVLIVAQSWGYILASDGQVILLDEEGQTLGGFNFFEPLTAIASIDRNNFLIATRLNQQSQLYNINLEATIEKH